MSVAGSIYELENFARMLQDSVASESFAVTLDGTEFTADPNSFSADTRFSCAVGQQIMNTMFCGMHSHTSEYHNELLIEVNTFYSQLSARVFWRW